MARRGRFFTHPSSKQTDASVTGRRNRWVVAGYVYLEIRQVMTSSQVVMTRTRVILRALQSFSGLEGSRASSREILRPSRRLNGPQDDGALLAGDGVEAVAGGDE